MQFEYLKERVVDGAIGVLQLLLTGVDVALSTVLTLVPSNKKNKTEEEHDLVNKKQVVIVGASFAGCKIEQILSQHNVDVTLIDFREYFEYIPGSLRCFVEPTHFKTLSCSLQERNRKSTKFVQGKLVDIPTNNEIVLEGNRTLPFDYLVLSCGSTYATSVKADETITSWTQRHAQYHDLFKELQDASKVIIVGAGAVGVELAGEIMTTFPQKRVVLVDMAPAILIGFHESSIQYATNWLKKNGAELHLGAPIKTIDDTFVELNDGTKLDADLVYRCFGAAPNTSFLKQSVIKGSLHGPKGAVVVNDHLQVEGFMHIYCAGDMNYHAASNEIKLGHTAELNGDLVAENILHQIHNNKTALFRYPMDVVGAERSPFMYCVSLGKYDATLGFNQLVINGPLAAIAKWLIEWTQVAMIRKQPIGIYFWMFSDIVANFVGRTVLSTERKRPL